MLYVGFNTASGPCRDAGLRRALQQSFDRDAVVTAQFSRHALAAALPVSPVSPLYDGALAGRLAYSSQALAQALAGAGWSQTDGSWRRGRETLALRFVVPGENTDRISAAEQLAKNLTDEGVSVELKKLSWEDYTAVLARGDFDLYLAEVRLTGDFDLTALLAPTGALNYGGYCTDRCGTGCHERQRTGRTDHKNLRLCQSISREQNPDCRGMAAQR